MKNKVNYIFLYKVVKFSVKMPRHNKFDKFFNLFCSIRPRSGRDDLDVLKHYRKTYEPNLLLLFSVNVDYVDATKIQKKICSASHHAHAQQ